MLWRTAAGLLLASLTVMSAAAEDPRAPIKLPPDVRAAFMEEMRHHMDSLRKAGASRPTFRPIR